MAQEPYPFWLKNPRKQRIPDRVAAPEPGDERETTAIASRRSPRPKQLEAGSFAADIGSFALHLAAEGKAPSTIRNTPRRCGGSPGSTCCARRVSDARPEVHREDGAGFHQRRTIAAREGVPGEHVR
jgi:hypothetical protein